VCKEGDIIFWQISDERKVNKICQFKTPVGKRVKDVHVVAKAYHRHEPKVLNDRIIVVFKSGESELFDFEIGNKVELVEGEESNLANAHLFLLENEKQKEHDCKVTGVDSNLYVRLIVTSDTSGSIKIWSLEKRFMREIQFPHPIDSVCFLNEKGDILVSHVQRISLIRFDTYWTSSFTHYGFTS
jgi:WD40 repeat protein